MNEVINRIPREKDELQARIGHFDPRDLGLTEEELRLAQEDEQWMSAWLAKESHKYCGKYVAVKGKKVIASSESLKEVNDIVEAQSLRWVIIDYIPSGLIIYKNAI
jgi:hypothetical protein